ncbi:hypothetical protein EP47_12475 [Legionella norrlandica]|uniref:DUF6444 domain-containing protein n=1 Tax=Legionella norrlandica TaxID=1498499 RepID=A0A0A2SVU2_9GAMM|nr:DUF6444 domain-containing protein [Legionella norrlandica]KGP63836.1 hypothetical protein EP47_12475 [Legionella norrlandica]
MTNVSKINLAPKTLGEAIETIGHLAKIIVELKEENLQLKEENRQLREENAWLKEQLNTNSKNSSLPPSRDLKKKKQIKRDFQKISERPRVPGKIGKKLLKAYERLFKFWKTEYNPNMLSFKKPRKRLRYFKARVLRHVREGMRCKHKATARTCTNILESVDSLWNVFDIPNVPPTNNHAER